MLGFAMHFLVLVIHATQAYKHLLEEYKLKLITNLKKNINNLTINFIYQNLVSNKMWTTKHNKI